MRLLFTILLTVFLIFFASAQTAIEGKIIDNENTPLEFANVLLLNPIDSSFIRGHLTNNKGIYKFENIETGDYLLSIAMIGYATTYNNINVESIPQKTISDIILEKSVALLDEVNVVAKKPLFEQKIDRMVVNVQNSVTSTGSNALAILARSPGVRVDQINNLINMNGGQSAIIMINDKRTRMDAAALIQMLEGMPAENIEKIELITTPPASYDAEGDAGIINIVLVKNNKEGINGNLSLGIGYGQRPKSTASYNLNWKKGKFNFFTNGSAWSSFTQENTVLRQSINTGEGGLLNTDVFSDRPAFEGFYDARIGLDYEWNDRTTIGVLFSGFLRYWDLDAQTTTTITDEEGKIETSDLRSLEKNDWTSWMANINFRHTFLNKAKLTLDYDYLKFDADNPASYFNKEYDTTNELVDENEFISKRKTPIYYHVAKVDYTLPISKKGNIEFGTKGTFTAFTNDVGVANINDNGEEVYDPAFTGIFDMEEYIYAAYIASDWNFTKNTSAKIGFRYEYTDTDLGSRSEGNLVKRQFGRIFPSLFFSHNFTENNSLQLSYSERIQRPDFELLAPAFFFFSPNNILQGNPSIKNTITRKIQASYRYKTLGISLQFSDDENPIVWGQPQINAEDNILVISAENMIDDKSIYASINFPLKITDWWESRYEFSGGWNRSKPIYEGQIVTQSNVSFSTESTQTFSLPKKMTLELNAWIYSGANYGLSRYPTVGGFNLGLQKTFKNNSKLSLNWQDPFNLSSFFELDFNQPELGLEYFWRYDMEGNIFKLTYSYPFGNNKIKKAGERKAASEEEKGRVR